MFLYRAEGASECFWILVLKGPLRYGTVKISTVVALGPGNPRNSGMVTNTPRARSCLNYP